MSVIGLVLCAAATTSTPLASGQVGIGGNPTSGQVQVTDKVNRYMSEQKGKAKTLFAFKKDGEILGTAELPRSTEPGADLRRLIRDAKNWRDLRGVPIALECKNPVASPPSCVICEDGTTICANFSVVVEMK